MNSSNRIASSTHTRISVRSPAGARQVAMDWAYELRPILLKAALLAMILLSVIFLGYEFWRLVFETADNPLSTEVNAVDLKQRYVEVRRWFSVPKSFDFSLLTYQPASYLMLWPLLGWGPLAAVRWLWALTSIALLVWLGRIIASESQASTRLEKWLIVLVPISMYATGATIGNGQLIIHLLTPMLAGLLILKKRPVSFKNDLLASSFILFSLVKSSIGVPFFWIAIFMPRRMRPAILVVSAYVMLTVLSFMLLKAPMEIDAKLLDNISQVAASSVEWGNEVRVADLPTWLHHLGMDRWMLPFSFLFVGLLGLWVWRHNTSDFWIICGVAGIWARFLTYHRWYDDLLLLPAMLALFRLAKCDRTFRTRLFAGVLFALMIPAMIAPGTLYLFYPPWNLYLEVLKSILWGVVLVYLMIRANESDLLAANKQHGVTESLQPSNDIPAETESMYGS